MFKRYRLFNGYRILSGCPYCKGAVFIYTLESSGGVEEKVLKCFQCGRMFRYKDGHLVLWPYREYPHLEGRQVFRVQQEHVHKEKCLLSWSGKGDDLLNENQFVMVKVLC